MNKKSSRHSQTLSISLEFLMFSMSNNILRFGKFKTKAGRLSPYFFDMGRFSNSKLLFLLGEFYSKKLLNAEKNGFKKVDCLFGPAYKGIPLVCTTAISLNKEDRLVEFAYNRKEEKKHGEGGNIVGNISGKNVLIVDDVISAGLSITNSIDLIKKGGGNPIGALVALDRMEISPADDSKNHLSASNEITMKTGLPVMAISDIKDLEEILTKNTSSESQTQLKTLQNYLRKWGGRY